MKNLAFTLIQNEVLRFVQDDRRRKPEKQDEKSTVLKRDSAGQKNEQI